jgi:hypothetical protein
MARQVRYLADDSVVMVEVSGPVNQNDLLATFTAGLTAGQEHSVKRILIDARAMTISSSATQLYNLPGLLHEYGLTRAHKVAILCAGNPAPNKDFLFLETLFFNRGFPLRLFPEMAEAMKWLQRTKHHTGAKARPTTES